MDNFHFDITSEGDAHLLIALKLALTNYKATHFLVQDTDPKTLILLWHQEGNALPFLTSLKAEALLPMVLDWTKQTPWPREPDHDGSNTQGWRVFNEAWGHVHGHIYAICGVQPAWAMHGK